METKPNGRARYEAAERILDDAVNPEDRSILALWTGKLRMNKLSLLMTAFRFTIAVIDVLLNQAEPGDPILIFRANATPRNGMQFGKLRVLTLPPSIDRRIVRHLD